MDFPGQFWLEKARVWIQLGWVALFGAALVVTFLALKQAPEERSALERRNGLARCVLAGAVVGFVGLWVLGATLELMRRAAALRGPLLFLAIAAFSVLLATIFMMVREWFAPIVTKRQNIPPQPIGNFLRAERVALTLGLLTLAGWWFGGFALEWNSLFRFAGLQYGELRWPDGWILALAGAQLLSASASVRPLLSNEEQEVRNPQPVTFWLAVYAFLAGWPLLGVSPLVALCVLAGYGVFGFQIWARRSELDHMSEASRRVVVALGITILLVFSWQWHDSWLGQQEVWQMVWRHPASWLELALLIGLAGAFGVQIRDKVGFERPASRALLNATLAGSIIALVAFGPMGVFYWAFLPLTGHFFDLLALRPEPNVEMETTDPFADPFADEAEVESQEDDDEPAPDETISIPVGSGSAQDS